MNVGKSIKVALALKEKNQDWLSKEMGVTRQQVSNLANSRSATSSSIEKVAKALNMSASDFIKLGE